MEDLTTKDAINLLVTGSTNGNVMVWDLSRPSSQKLDRTIQEHKRAVNRIAVHPREGILVLSASQDGTMKLWVRLHSRADLCRI